MTADPVCQAPGCARTIPHERARFRAAYCSEACRQAAKHARQVATFRALLPESARCVICKAEFTPRDRKQVTCGGECARTNKNRSRNQRMQAIKAMEQPEAETPPDDDGLGHLSALGHANTPAMCASRRSEAARIEAVVRAAEAAGTLGAITPGRSSQDEARRAVWSGHGIGCKKVG